MNQNEIKELVDALARETAYVQTHYTICKNQRLCAIIVIINMLIHATRLSVRNPGVVYSYCRELYQGRNG